MVSDYLRHSRDLDEVYALIDKNRADAALAAQAKFHNDMEAAIAAIASIGAIAGARVQADSRVASAKVLINAELAATRLLAEAEVQAFRCAEQTATKPQEVVEAALLEIGRHTSVGLIAAAKDRWKKSSRTQMPPSSFCARPAPSRSARFRRWAKMSLSTPDMPPKWPPRN